jgi:DNA-binding NarL/FixJ family response regulator
VTKILIADNHDSMRRALRTTVKMHPNWEVCGEATDGREAVDKATQLHPDVVVLDFKMPRADGLKAGSEIRMSMPTVPILMYTLYKTRALEVAAKMVGIRQVVGKEDGANQLLSAIESELANKKFCDEHRISRPLGPLAQSR